MLNTTYRGIILRTEKTTQRGEAALTTRCHITWVNNGSVNGISPIRPLAVTFAYAIFQGMDTWESIQ